MRDLFEKDPARPIESIIRVDQHDSAVVRTELEEYVVTENIKKDFSDIISAFIQSRTSIPQSVCGWISGFFGSGKSHFLKILGYVLSNWNIEMNSGADVRASQFFCGKHDIPGGAILEKQLKTKAIFVHMLTFDPDRGPSISNIVFEALLKELGLSTVPWIAEIERTLRKEGLWDQFLAFVRREEGKEWQESRKMQVKARPILARALTEIDPRRFPTLDIASKSIDDVKGSLKIDQSLVVERLLELAEEIDPINGRVVILLDEVGLYVGSNTDRLNDLNTISEQVAKIGKGKIWLFVTAQEALEEVVPKILGYTSQFQKIRDRFQLKIQLTPENIDTVVKKRLLQKKLGHSLELLAALYSQHSGNLATTALIKNPARDHHSLFTQLNQQEFMDSYPFMPYHIRLMQEIFGLLRSRGNSPQALTGRERAVLQVVRSILREISDKKIGHLATFDLVYDAINDELKTIGSVEHAVIDNDIAHLDVTAGIPVSSVAKALFLLQRVGQWLPCTAENIAATLYPDLKIDSNEHLTGVKKCLELLIAGKWIIDEEAKFRFLSEIERTFEQDIERQMVNEPDRKHLSDLIAKQVLSEIKTYNFESVRTFNIHITADDEEINSNGHVNIIFYTPNRSARENLIEIAKMKSLSTKDTIYWISSANERYPYSLDRAIKLRKALAERERNDQSDDEQRALDKHKKELDLLENDDLPLLLRKAASSGILIYQGEELVCNGKRKINEIFNDQIKKVIKEIFTELSFASYRVEKDDHIGMILTWQGSRLPRIYYDLKLIDASNNIVTDRPVVARILSEVKRRTNQEVETQTGQSLTTYFESPPFGWDSKIIRLALAALFKNGSIIVNIGGTDYLSSSDDRSHEAFLTLRGFSRARFLIGQEVTKEQKREASDMVNEIFGEPGGNTVEEVDKSISKVMVDRLDICNRFCTIASERNLPVKDDLTHLCRSINAILLCSSPSRRIHAFLESQHQENFRNYVPLLEKLSRFESNNLQKYYGIRDFINDNGQTLSDGNNTISSTVERLNLSIQSKNFLSRWSDILEDFQKIIANYSLLYIMKHRERTKIANEAVQELKQHPSLRGDMNNTGEEKLSTLSKFLCGTDQPVIDADKWRCKECNASLTDLMNHIFMIEGNKQKIYEQLNELWMQNKDTNKNHDNVEGFEVIITSPSEIPSIISKMKHVIEASLKLGKLVKLNVKVDE